MHLLLLQLLQLNSCETQAFPLMDNTHYELNLAERCILGIKNNVIELVKTCTILNENPDILVARSLYDHLMYCLDFLLLPDPLFEGERFTAAELEQLIWRRIKEVYLKLAKFESGAFDILARLIDLFFPCQQNSMNHFSVRHFEILKFDLCNEDPEILSTLLQIGLVDDEGGSLVSKNSLYILNKIVQFTKFMDSSGKPSIFNSCPHWDRFLLAFTALQEPQVHLVTPVLAVIASLLESMGVAWWQVLIIKGLQNESIQARKVIFHEIFTFYNPSRLPSHNSLFDNDFVNFILKDLFPFVDHNSALLSKLQSVAQSDKLVDFGLLMSKFYGDYFNAYFSKMGRTGLKLILKRFINEILANAKSTVPLIYATQSLLRVGKIPCFDDCDLSILSLLSQMTSLHNPKARILVKWQLTQSLVNLIDYEEVSFKKLSTCLTDLVLEQIQVGSLTANCDDFKRIASWLENKFPSPSYLEENISILSSRFFEGFSQLDSENIKLMKQQSHSIAVLSIFTLGRPNGLFGTLVRPILGELNGIIEGDSKISSKKFFLRPLILFLDMNQIISATLEGKSDLISLLFINEKVFDIISNIDKLLFQSTAQKFDCNYDEVLPLLSGLDLFIEKATVDNSNELIKLLDIILFRICSNIEIQASSGANDPLIQMNSQLYLMAELAVLKCVLEKFENLGLDRSYLLSESIIHYILHYNPIKPVDLTEFEWESWPPFFNSFTAFKWSCIEAIASTISTCKSDKINVSLVSLFASCLQALELSKYGATLSILKCMGTLVDLVTRQVGSKTELLALIDESIIIMKDILGGHRDTPRWFDLYADGFICFLLRPSILNCSELSECQEADGSLKDAFDYLTRVVAPKRPGIMAMVARTLCSYWSKADGFINLGTFWHNEFVEMTVWGPIRESIDESIASRITGSSIINNDYHARISVNSLLNHLDPKENFEHFTFLQIILLDLLDLQKRAIPPSKKVFPGDFSHRVKLRSWCSIVLVLGILLKSDIDSSFIVDRVLERLWHSISEESMPSTKSLIEWSISLVYLRFPVLIYKDFVKLRFKVFEPSSSTLISILTIAILVSKKIEISKDSKGILSQMLNTILPLFIHNNHNVRMHAIFAFKSIYTLLGQSCSFEGYLLLDNFIETAEHCKKFISKLEEDEILNMNGFDPTEDCSIEWIFYKMMIHGGIESEAIDYLSFMNINPKEGTIPFGKMIPIAPMGDNDKDSVSDRYELQVGEKVLDQLSKDFQRKIDTFYPFSNDDLIQGKGDNDDFEPIKRSPVFKTEIIIIGSLLDRIPNIAGLARTCEIFQVSRLYVPDLKILETPDFQNIAMTADKWLDIRMLPPNQIVSFLMDLRKECKSKDEEGYKILAVEQTCNSTPLQNYTFPPKLCLILGNERRGVPVEILHQVDQCIEIPQFGQIRSLNVHVTGSIVIWKAREQDILTMIN